MDDAARLVAELSNKLAELDGKVAAYQRDLLAEFHRHMHECLKNYPDNVTNEVSRVIAQSMSAGRYPALSPATRDVPPDSPASASAAASGRIAWDGRKSPPPILPHTSGTPKEAPRDPHAREREFQGLFTPTYLPLLESSSDRSHNSPTTSPPTSPPQSTSDGPALALSADNVKKVEEEANHAVSGGGNEVRPSPLQRRLTGLSASSVESSGSDFKRPRSALRRSSSSNKGSSPRRVRFEFEGEEVFPASSSPTAPAALPPLVTDALGSGAETQPPKAEAAALSLVTQDESTEEYSGPSLLDVEGEEDLLPRPKKVSSTQALQALTRSPLEEGTVWTVVNPDTDEPVKMNGEKETEVAPQLATKVDSQETVRAECEQRNGSSRSSVQESAVYDDDEESASEEEEFLSMRPRKSPSPAAKPPFAPPPAQSSTASRRPPPVNTTITNGQHSTNDIDLDETHDPLFDFDDEPSSTSSTQKYLPDADSDSDSEPTPGRLRKAARDESSTTSTNIPPVSPSAVLFGHSIGSYMGRSMTITPIKDPKLYDEIAGMKGVPFFVGSIHDRTEAELAMGSYSASAARLRGSGVGGVPRSFTERLAMEEEMERRRVAGEGEGDGEEDDDF